MNSGNHLHKHLYFFLFFFISIPIFTKAQQSLYVAQSLLYGGALDDAGLAIALNDDGEELYLGGRSASSDGFLSDNNGGSDYWIMRTTLDGDTLWSNNFGGSNSEQLNALLPQPDGSVFGFGTTFSDLAELGTLNGLYGAWLMRANTDGELIFAKMISSNIGEKGIDLVQTNANNITLLGETASNELEGEMNHGVTDFFVIRMTTAGIIAWTKVYGGNNLDEPSAMINTSDAGMIIAGSSMSDGGDVDTNRGDFDMWILKLLPNGQIDWSKTFGGSGEDKANDIIQLTDGSFLVTGSTNSNDGDISQPGPGGTDLWLIHISSDGNLLWEKRYGGSENDEGRGIESFVNGSFILIGATNSIDVDLTGNKGETDEWVLQVDEGGNIIKQMNYGGPKNDIPEAIVSNANEVFILGRSKSIGGSLPPSLLMGENMWLLKMSTDSFVCSETLICRQDTINDSNVIDVAANGGIACISGCTVGLDTGPSFIQSSCIDVIHETAFIMINTDDNADFMTISVESGEFNLPYLVLAQSQNCINFTPLDCAFGYNGTTLIENIPVQPNTLYAAIVSDLEGNVGDFNLCVSVIDVEFCNIESSLYATATSMGSPLEGPFLPGEEVTMCYELTDWRKLECNGLQGIVPTFGIGWDSISFDQFGMPIQIDTPLVNIAGGSWDWYTLGAVTYNTFNPVNGLEGGQGMVPGWYFLNTDGPPPNTSPNETVGDISLCTPTDDKWKICFTLKTKSECTENIDCSVSIKTYADGELGVNTSLACGYDPEITLSTELNCCINPNISNIPDLTRCTGDTIIFPFQTNIPGNVEFSWTVLSVDEGILGASDGNSQIFSQILENIETFDQTVTYEVNAGAEFCAANPEVFTIIVRPRPRTIMTLVSSNQVCSGDQIELQWTNTGVSPFLAYFTANGVIQDTLLLDNIITSVFLTPDISTQYVAVGFSDQNCIGSASGLVNVEVLPNPEVTLNEVICEGESFSIGDLTFDIPGQYSVTIPNGSVNGCDSTVNLTLGVAPVQESSLDTFICTGETLIFGNDTLTKSGVYPVVLLNQFGCDSIINVNLTIADDMSNEMSQTICHGNTVIFNGIEISESGTYTDTTFLNDFCFTVDILNLNVLPAILVDSLTINPDNGNGTGAIFLEITGGTPPYTYIWNNGSTTGSLTDLESGQYSVEITDDAGCKAEFSFSVPLSTSSKDILALQRQVHLYPNPLSQGNSLVVKYTGEGIKSPIRITFQDIVSNQIFEDSTLLPGDELQLGTNGLPAGLYIVRFEKNGIVAAKKVIIQ